MLPKLSSKITHLNSDSDKTYKTLKIGVCRKSESQEVKVLNYLKEVKSSNDGRYCVRRACDFFEIQVPSGRHHCIVYEPLGMSLLDYVIRQQDHTLNIGVAKWIMMYLLKAIDYLHSSGVVHTGTRLVFDGPHLSTDLVSDIKLDNIQKTLPDEETAILESFVNAERTEPSPRKFVDESRTIYTSRPLEYGDVMTFPILSDLGTCMFGQEKYEQVIQAVPYRSPEVILRMTWNCSVDIWNLGVLVSRAFFLVSVVIGVKLIPPADLPQLWELLFAEHLFGSNSEQDSLAMMITYLGPPPPEWLERSQVRERYFDDHGK